MSKTKSPKQSPFKKTVGTIAAIVIFAFGAVVFGYAGMAGAHEPDKAKPPVNWCPPETSVQTYAHSYVLFGDGEHVLSVNVLTTDGQTRSFTKSFSGDAGSITFTNDDLGPDAKEYFITWKDHGGPKDEPERFAVNHDECPVPKQPERECPNELKWSKDQPKGVSQTFDHDGIAGATIKTWDNYKGRNKVIQKDEWVLLVEGPTAQKGGPIGRTADLPDFLDYSGVTTTEFHFDVLAGHVASVVHSSLSGEVTDGSANSLCVEIIWTFTPRIIEEPVINEPTPTPTPDSHEPCPDDSVDQDPVTGECIPKKVEPAPPAKTCPVGQTLDASSNICTLPVTGLEFIHLVMFIIAAFGLGGVLLIVARKRPVLV